MSVLVRAGKAGKAFLKKYILPPPEPKIRYARRIERVKTKRRICVMTFDDGPMDMPASPELFDGESLTDVLLDTLGRYNAKGTFDIIGDTSENYPDRAGKEGSASWGGVRYDHYPDIFCDEKGGAAHNDRLLRRILSEGHQLTSHGYRHILFGRKSYVYNKRVFLGSLQAALDDLARLHRFILETYGYELKFHRPPHYVDKIGDGHSSYDVCERLGYQYLGASYDGAGWLPLGSFEEEVDAMVSPMRAALNKDPDFFCGQILFQKDGYNMARRTPVAVGLDQQLALLRRFGYEVVTVEELLAESPFADVGREDPQLETYIRLAKARGIAYSDNTLRLERVMSWEELAMLLAPKEEVLKSLENPNAASLSWCKGAGLIPPGAAAKEAVTELPAGVFSGVPDFSRRSVYAAFKG